MTYLYFMRYIVQFNIVNVIFVQYSNHFHSQGGSWCHEFEIMTLCLWPLTYWTQNQQTSTDCRGLLLCQVSSHADGFSFYRANIPSYPHTHPHTHTHTLIMTKWSQYRRFGGVRHRRTTSSTPIIYLFIYFNSIAGTTPMKKRKEKEKYI